MRQTTWLVAVAGLFAGAGVDDSGGADVGRRISVGGSI